MVIAPPADRLIDLLTTHYPAFERTQPLQESVRHAMQMVTFCHTAALGGHVECCPHGHIERVFYNSCGHRFCPRCAGRKRRKWLLDRQATLLPVRHYHAVFTVPHALKTSDFHVSIRTEPAKHGASKGLFYPSCGLAWIFVRPARRDHIAQILARLSFLLTTTVCLLIISLYSL